MVTSLKPPEWGDRMVKKALQKNRATAVVTLFATLNVSAIGTSLPGLG
ncbi:MAG: hypothetical protein ACQEQ0_09650 [Bacteroidota bacterium]